MTYERATKSSGEVWLDEDLLTSPQMNHVETGLVNAVDGYGGGTYNLEHNTLIFDGYNAVEFNALVVNGNSAFVGDVITYGDEAHNGHIEQNGKTQFNDDVAFAPITGGRTVNITSDVSIDPAKALTVGGTLEVDGNSAFVGTVIMQGDEAHSGAEEHNGTLSLNGDVKLLTAGKIVERITTGTNANGSYGVDASDTVKCNPGTTGPANVYTLTETSAVNGASILFYVPQAGGGSRTVLIKDHLGSLIASISTDATADTNWVEIKRVSGAWERVRGLGV